MGIMTSSNFWEHRQEHLDKNKFVGKFNGGYGREGNIWLEEEKCSLCGNTTVCIASDGSEEEYDYACMCLSCIRSAFKKWEEVV